MNFSLCESNITKRGQTTIIANVIRFEQVANGKMVAQLSVYRCSYRPQTWQQVHGNSLKASLILSTEDLTVETNGT